MPHAERLSLQGFNIAGGFLDTWRQFLQEDIQQLHWEYILFLSLPDRKPGRAAGRGAGTEPG